MLFNPLDYTTVFLSYDEPNSEENYRHLLGLNPQALRVHGVKGSDTAHKEVAKLSKTDSVIIVDADNFVKPSFFTNTIDLPDLRNLETKVLSFSAYNTINGNCYGNGGIKVWPVSTLLSMKTHENGTGVDFNMSNYVELDIVASEIHFASNYQAFRAGFREGVKLLLENDKQTNIDRIDYRNFDRLWIWCHVGIDIPFGNYAMLGARLAVKRMLTENFNIASIIDFGNIETIFKEAEGTNIQSLHDIHHLFGDILSEEDSARYRLKHIPPYRIKNNLDTGFKAWAHYFQLGTKLSNNSEANKLQVLCRSTPFGKYKFDGIRLGREHRENNKHNSYMLSKIYDYDWLKEKYDRLYTDTI